MTRHFFSPLMPTPTAFKAASFAVQYRKKVSQDRSLPRSHSSSLATLPKTCFARGFISSTSIPILALLTTAATHFGL